MLYFQSLVYSFLTKHMSILKNSTSIQPFGFRQTTLDDEEIKDLLRMFQDDPPHIGPVKNGISICLVNFEGRFVIHLCIDKDNAELFLNTVRFCQKIR